MHSTTILGVKKGDEIALGGDGQVTLEKTALKHTAVKVRPLYQGRAFGPFELVRTTPDRSAYLYRINFDTGFGSND